MSKSSLPPISLFWFRRDLRLNDNAGLFHALKDNLNVLPLFIFDADILEKLRDPADPRLSFIHHTLAHLKDQLQKRGSDLIVRYGRPVEVYKNLFQEFAVESVYTNHDYEPYARQRDGEIEELCTDRGVAFHTFKDQCLFEKEEILTDSRKPYTVFTPYKRKVLQHLNDFYLQSYPSEKYFGSLQKIKPEKMIQLKEMKFEKSRMKFPPAEVSIETLKNYQKHRDFPAIENGTSHLGLHLRFGILSVRELARAGQKFSQTWLSELIWRDFFMQILWHYPEVQTQSFRPQYDRIQWRKSPTDFAKWCRGQTGYKLVDAGMRELNATGYMHNRVRMVVASFLCKHLLIHWYEGERYFAEKLLDYDLSANNGNWQWAAGSGCDAAPYFRIFNPLTQAEKFDADNEYIEKWVPEWNTSDYVKPMVEHGFARDRCLRAFNQALK